MPSLSLPPLYHSGHTMSSVLIMSFQNWFLHSCRAASDVVNTKPIVPGAEQAAVAGRWRARRVLALAF
jgi:hypothetical protein